MNLKIEYSKWKNEHQSILQILINKKTFFTFSGGKDSSVSLYLLEKASKEFGFNFEIHAALFPQKVLGDTNKSNIERFWQSKGININWHETQESDNVLEDALNHNIDPCLMCGQIKKKAMMQYMKDSFKDLSTRVIVMSYSLWDLVSSTIEHILNAYYSNPEYSNRITKKDYTERFIETSQRFYPFIKLNDGFSIFKPLIYYNDQEIRSFITEKNIPICTMQCEHHNYRPKRVFAKYYQQVDLHFDYQKVLQFAENVLNLPDISFFEEIDMKEYLQKVI
jgi:tRNA(Ile)-lysidine synthase TilS/MesJ